MGTVLFFFVAGAVLLSGCARNFTYLVKPPSGPFNDRISFIENVSPVAQTAFQCGPASLESVIRYWGAQADAAEISRSLYKPHSRGVLNFSLVQYTRERGFWTLSVGPNEEALKSWVKRKIPSIVMLHTGVLWLENYHFLVVRGFNNDERIYYANTGLAQMQAIPYAEFEKRWRRAGRWGFAMCPPERVDWELNEEDAVDLALFLEKRGQLALAERWYKDALGKNPANDAARFNLANVYFKTNRRSEAKDAYTEILKRKPAEASVSNNLAWVYYEEGNYEEAVWVIERAFQSGAERRYDILDTAAMACCKQHKLERAKEYFLEARKNAPPENLEAVQTIETHRSDCLKDKTGV